MIYEIHINVSR